jgi:hypothetical protein
MDPTMVLSYAKKAVGDKAWTVELVLRIGAELAAFVNKVPNLSGKDKCQLVCQTILKMLDDVEKVERERSVESTEREKTIALLGECRNAVNVVLPVSLELMVMASRGKIVLKKVGEGCVWGWSFCWKSWVSLYKPCGSLKALEEMRDLVAKAEALVAEAKAASSQATVVAVKEEVSSGVGLQLPPILESPVVTLPGELVALSEVSAPRS